MQKVSKQEFDSFYERNDLTELPKWNAKECSITWKYASLNKQACRIVEEDGIIQFYIDLD